MTKKQSRGRIDIIDLWRGVAIVCMICYHFMYNLTRFGYMSADTFFSPPLNAFQLFICGSFIIISGVSSKLSKNNIKRGFIVLVCAMAVSVGAILVGERILFGILHFLGCAMIIYGLLSKYLDKIPKVITPIMYVALFVITKIWTESQTTTVEFLFPLGFLYPGFRSADYFPILPWLFLFLLGTYIGSVVEKKRDAPLFNIKIPAALTFPGRHSLIIYMLHQPVLYGLMFITGSL